VYGLRPLGAPEGRSAPAPNHIAAAGSLKTLVRHLLCDAPMMKSRALLRAPLLIADCGNKSIVGSRDYSCSACEVSPQSERRPVTGHTCTPTGRLGRLRTALGVTAAIVERLAPLAFMLPAGAFT